MSRVKTVRLGNPGHIWWYFASHHSRFGAVEGGETVVVLVVFPSVISLVSPFDVSGVIVYGRYLILCCSSSQLLMNVGVLWI